MPNGSSSNKKPTSRDQKKKVSSQIKGIARREEDAAAKIAFNANKPREYGKASADPEPGSFADRADNDQMLSTNQGVPVGNNQHSLKAGLRGPALLEDFILREKITHFDHEPNIGITRESLIHLVFRGTLKSMSTLPIG